MRSLRRGFIACLAAIAAVFTTALCAWAGVASFDPYPAASEATTSNLVLIVRFPGDTAGDADDGFNASLPESYLGNADGVTTQAQYLVRKFNAPDNSGYVKGSFRWYFKEVSGGQCDPISRFPQLLDSGRIAYLDLPQSAEVYLADYNNGHDTTLLNDVSACFAQFLETSDFDMDLVDLNGDGVVDNLTIIPQVSQNVFVSHKGDAYMQQLGSKTIGTYTLVDTGLVGYNDVSVAAHEYMHTLGAVDLYRNAVEGTPVGYWDIMARGGARSWPLAITRQRVGWLGDLPEVSASDAAAAGGTYELTLHAANTADEQGNAQTQAVVLRSPLNDSEYFIAEYRQKGDRFDAAGLDGWIGGSGVVVYRVNPAYAEYGNIAGDDYVYVFRQGETSLSASGGDSTNAQLGTAEYDAARTSLGSTDLSAGYADDTVFYSDGSNSGIVVSVTAQSADSATIQVSFADYTSEDLWEPLNSASGSCTPNGVAADSVQCVASGDSLYALVRSEGLSTSGSSAGCSVYRYDAATQAWDQMGAPIAGLMQSTLVCNGEDLVAVGTDSSYGCIKAYEFANNAWSLCAQTSANVNDASAGTGYQATGTGGTATGAVYAFADGDRQVYRLDGKQFTAVGSALSMSYATSACFFGAGGNDYLLCCDFFNSQSVVYRIDASECVQVASLSHGVKEPQVAVIGDVAYLFACDTATGAYPVLISFDGTSVEETRIAQFTQADAGAALATDGSMLYLALAETAAENSPVNVYTAFPVKAMQSSATDASTWTQLGASACTGASDVSLALAGGMACCGSSGSEGTAMVRSHALRDVGDALLDGESLDSVRIQLPIGFDAAQQTTADLRFAFAVDALSYESAGLLFISGEADDALLRIGETGVRQFSTQKAYRSIYVNGVQTLVADALDTSRNWAVAVKMTGVPAQAFSTAFTVRAYVVKCNGSIAYGPVRTFSVDALVQEG